MFKCLNCILDNDERLLKMMSDSLSIYDKALYFQRQSYFETKEQGRIKTYSYVDLYNIVKNEDVFKNSKLDINIKQQAIKQVCNDWLSFIKSTISYRNNKSKFLSKPKMPNYLYKKKDWNILYVDKTRFRKVDESDNSFNLPCSDYRVYVPKQIDLKDIRQITIQKYYGKIKINFIYKDEEIIKNQIDKGSCVGIDLGVNNLCAITSNDKPLSYVVNGRPLKSVNQYYNKKLSELKSQLEKCNKRNTSKKTQRLTMKRNNKVNHYLHCVSKQLIDFCIENNIEKIVIGHNKGWKNKSNMGKRNNQNFAQIPFNKLISQLTYKSLKYTNLSIVVVEESYTSKTDHLVTEEMKRQDSYLGKRVKRGLFQSSIGKSLNADINGAIGILRKGNAITDGQLTSLRDRGDVVSPKVFTLNL